MGRIVISKHPNFKEGDFIVGAPMEWATYSIVKKDMLVEGGFAGGFRKASAQGLGFRLGFRVEGGFLCGQLPQARDIYAAERVSSCM